MNLISPSKCLRATPVAVLSILLLAGTFGCSMGSLQESGAEAPVATKGPVVQGSVFGGQQPITGATLQLYAAGAPASGGGYGSGALALIPVLDGTTTGYFPGGAPGCVPSANGVTPVVTCTTLPSTDSSGSFTISNDYSCPTATSQVYLVATGGNPQLSGGSANPYITLLAALGPCNSTNLAGNPSLNPNSFVSINEVTTISSVIALQQFMSTPATSAVEQIGAPGHTYNGVQSAVVGMTNSFGMVSNLVNTQYGTSPGTNTAFIVESSLIYTLADILAYCINSDPNNASSPSANCSTLMTDATPTGSTTATDTLQAAFYMARNPYHNVAKLFTDIPPTPPFTAVSTAPADFTLQVQVEPSYYSAANSQIEPAVGSGVSMAFDQYGNAWVLNLGRTTTVSTPTAGSTIVPGSVTEIGANGTVLLSPVAAYNASTTGGAYSEFTTPPASNIRTFTGAANAGIVAIDTNNNAWVANNRDAPTVPAGGSIAVLPGSAGANVINNGTPGGYYTAYEPDGVAIDGNNNVFVAMTASGLVSGKSIGEFAAGSSAFTYSTMTTTGAPYALPGNNTKIALGQTTAVTNSLVPASPVSNDGPLLWTSNLAGCNVSSNTYGTFNQYTSKDLLPTANSLFSSTGACPASTKVASVLPALTGNPTGIVLDRNDNVWIADTFVTATGGFDGVTFVQANAATGVVDPTYGAVAYNPSPGVAGTLATGFKQPYGIAIDGNNNAWIGNIGINQIIEMSSTVGTASTAPTVAVVGIPKGASSHMAAAPQYPAIDSSGNVWTVQEANIGQTGLPVYASTRANLLNILVGAAAPVVTPLSVAIANKVVGQKP